MSLWAILKILIIKHGSFAAALILMLQWFASERKEPLLLVSSFAFGAIGALAHQVFIALKRQARKEQDLEDRIKGLEAALQTSN